MDWVPQTTEPEMESPPDPPIPPKMIEIALFDVPQDDTKMGPPQSRVLIKQGNDSAPVLPPKPKYVIYNFMFQS
jgi:hypothetical protein